MSTTLINVGGTSRSGSTMLHLILGSSPEGVAVGEALNWFRPVKQHHFELVCGCGREDCRRWDFIRNVDESQFHRAVAEHTGLRFVVDSSKEIGWLIDSRRWADRSGVSCINIFVWKDPIELAYSFWKRGGDLMFWRSQFLKYYKRVFQSGLPIATVNLGDVVRNARATVAGLTRAVGMEYTEGMERFWEHEHHHLFGNYGVKRQIQIGESYFQSPTFSDEFRGHLPYLEEKIRHDEQVRDLVEKLRRLDISRTLSAHEMEDRQRVHLSHPFPLWYHAQKAKRQVLRYRPQARDRTLSHSAATIPVKDPES